MGEFTEKSFMFLVSLGQTVTFAKCLQIGRFKRRQAQKKQDKDQKKKYLE